MYSRPLELPIFGMFSLSLVETEHENPVGDTCGIWAGVSADAQVVGAGLHAKSNCGRA